MPSWGVGATGRTHEQTQKHRQNRGTEAEQRQKRRGRAEAEKRRGRWRKSSRRNRRAAVEHIPGSTGRTRRGGEVDHAAASACRQPEQRVERWVAGQR